MCENILDLMSNLLAIYAESQWSDSNISKAKAILIRSGPKSWDICSFPSSERIRLSHAIRTGGIPGSEIEPGIKNANISPKRSGPEAISSISQVGPKSVKWIQHVSNVFRKPIILILNIKKGYT
jgi:hypothetical protein